MAWTTTAMERLTSKTKPTLLAGFSKAGFHAPPFFIRLFLPFFIPHLASDDSRETSF